MQAKPNDDGWEAWLKQLLTPRFFFAGLALGFAACCIAGRKAPAALTFRDFQRFESPISPEGLYFPTALQVRGLARQHLPTDKIAVVIGGSSIMRGFGQPSADLWSAHLQEKLGDGFQVLNLALDGGAPHELGALTAEMLLREGRKVVYVSNCNALQFAAYPDGTVPEHRYFFHEARARDLLLPFPERDAALRELEPQRRASDGLDELQLRVAANRLLSFNDFWHIAAYEVCCTVWHKKLGSSSWRARKRFKVGDDFRRRLPSANEISKVRRKLVQNIRPFTADDRTRLELQVRQSMPPALRACTIVTMNRFNPVHVALLEAELPGSAAHFEARHRAVRACLQACGLQAADGFALLTGADFFDGVHLGPSGGVKLADALAPEIRDLAHRLQYLRREAP